MRSSLIHIQPDTLTVVPSKLNTDECNITWGGIDFEETRPVKLADVFMEALESVKLYGYFVRSYKLMIEHLFQNIMRQNKSVSRMAWHFLVANDFPYCLSIERADMHQRKYCVKLTLGLEASARYFDSVVDEDGEEELMFNKTRYLKTFPNYMKPADFLISDNAETQLAETLLERMIAEDPCNPILLKLFKF